jgi:hypothetical protein
MWVFGGERASVAFNDVWALDLKAGVNENKHSTNDKSGQGPVK